MIAYSGIDIDAVHAQLLACPGSTAADLAFSLVAEAKRLRAECRTLQEWCEIAAEAENQNADEARKERAAVVAWLRREIAKCGCDDDTAACIERGEHRREEKE